MSNDSSTSSSSRSLQNSLTKSQTAGVVTATNQSKQKKSRTNKKKRDDPGTSKVVTDKNTSSTKEKFEGNLTSQISTEKNENIVETKKFDFKITESFETLPIIEINDETNLLEVLSFFLCLSLVIRFFVD
jgi:hypothetical protein